MKKMVALILVLLMVVAAIPASAEGEPTVLTMWTFIAQHQEFYEYMETLWNEANPDRKVDIQVTTLGYDDMHNKLKVALAAGEGAPDICDVELGQFPNVLAYSDKLVELKPFMESYMPDLVQARFEIYAKDGGYYGVPTHVGAMVCYYNVELLEAAGIDYTTISTWDDWYEAGLKLIDQNPDAFMGTVETSTQWVASLMLAQQGVDWQDGELKPTINTPELIKVIETQQKWLDAEICETCPGGQPDTEEGKAYVAGGNVACVIMPFWFMSRFTDEIGESVKGKYVVAPCPVFEEGQIRSIGQGGTGTVVYAGGTDPKLAAEFLVHVKITELGNQQVWSFLGFDPINTAVWSDDAVMKTDDNKYNQYFVGYPVDAILAVRDEIGYVLSTSISPAINTYLGGTLWTEVYIDGRDAAEAAADAQTAVEAELF